MTDQAADIQTSEPSATKDHTVTAFCRVATSLGRPFVGMVLAVSMLGFAAAPTPLTPQAQQAVWQAEWDALDAAKAAKSPAAAAAALAAVMPPPAATSPSAPAPGLIQHSRPPGTPAPLDSPSTAFTFLNTHPDGSPVAYDPCEVIHYVTRPDNAPAGGDRLVAEAIAAVSLATGLVFINDGATDEAPTQRGNRLFQPDRYGDRWAPVLIAWATPAEEPRFEEIGAYALGTGGSSQVSIGESPSVYVSGAVTFNAANLGRRMTRPGGADLVYSVIVHELAHLVGLDHRNDEGQLMHWQATVGTHDLQSGDLAGLALLGQGPCEPRF